MAPKPIPLTRVDSEPRLYASDHDFQSHLTQIFSTQATLNAESRIRLDEALRSLFFAKIYNPCIRIIEDPTQSREERRRAYLEQVDKTLDELTKDCQYLTRSCALSYPHQRSNQLTTDVFGYIQNQATFQQKYFSEHFDEYFDQSVGYRNLSDPLYPGTSGREAGRDLASESGSSFDAPEIPARRYSTGSDDSEGSVIERGNTESVDSENSDAEDADPDGESAQDLTGRLEHIWNHLTISKDRTSAANAAQELLFIFRASTFELEEDESRNSEARSRVADGVPASGFQLRYGRGGQDSGENHLQISKNVQFHRVEPRLAPRCPSTGPTLKTPRTGPIGSSSSQEVYSDSDSKLDDIRSSAESKPNMAGDDLYHQLRQQIASLEDENKNLKHSTSAPEKWQLLHFIQNDQRQPASAYIDEPSWIMDPKIGPVLTAYLPVTDIKGFLRQRNGLAFVVSRYYSPHGQRDDVLRASRAQETLPTAQWFRESLSFNSEEMMDAAQAFFDQIPNFKEDFPEFDVREHIQAPYLFWYHHRKTEEPRFAGLSPDHQELIEVLTNWIEAHYKERYDLVESQMAKGVVTQETMPFLFKPGDVAVWETKEGINATVSKSWLWQNDSPTLRRKPREREWNDESSAKTSKFAMEWRMDTWSYKYDGRLLKSPEELTIEFNTNWMDEEVEIRSLNVFPLRFAPDDVKTVLEKRGKTFWKCRYRNVISYEDKSGIYGNGERFVVDFQTYQQLHSDSVNFRKVYSNLYNDDCELMNTEMMESADPPPSPDIYVLPSTIPGYDLRSKKWVDLHVDLIQDVIWNKKSFDHLVVDDETKELVQALVRHQIASEKSTDIIDRKGNGLIMLLHGGPGTGKTFTAESVAELAEKPLFRVTCGDISTDPEKAEKYLNSVLHLGKTWGCVVLIDEAEVFLEQRSLDNLERNALVSVFLRVLEYYEGILILTSNRVGTFDEAFKSRILLSLHYENLTQGQRKKIWKNFLRRLKEMENETKPAVNGATAQPSNTKASEEEVSEIDFDDVECYLDELSQFDLNGRQIRNAITSARQLAMFRKQAMAYRHLKHVITVSSKFDNYLKKVQEGQTADQIARSDGVR